MKKYILLILAILFPIIIILCYSLFYDMSANNALCTFHSATGLECPGCGGQRALYLLLHGNVLQALRHNAFFVLALPFLAYFYYMAVRVYILNERHLFSSFVFSSVFGYGLLISLILFFLLRNIPAWPFFYLAPP